MAAQGLGRAVAIALSIGLACGAAGTPAVPAADAAKGDGKARELYDQAESEYDLGHFQKALDLFEQVYKLKKMPALLFNIAQCHRQLGALKEARLTYRRFLAKEPDNRFAKIAQEKLEEVEKALEAQASARTAPPTDLATSGASPGEAKPEAARPEPGAAAVPSPAPAPQAASPVSGGRCLSDVDCKGSRVCVRGACTESAAVASADTWAVQAVPPDPGWGRTGGITGLAGAGGTLVLALVAEGMNSADSNATGIGALAIAVASASAVVAGLGSSSVRGVEHSTALRVTGWVIFGLALADAVVLVATPDVHKPGGLITSVGALGFLGVGTLSLEAVLAAGEAESAALLRARQAGARVSPAVLPVRLAGGQAGAALGIAAVF